MLHYLLAVALLTSPPDSAERLATPAAWSARGTLQDLAVEWEILDERERRYVLARREDFATDLKLLQRRYEDLHDAPPISDSGRLPPREVLTDWLAFNRAFRTHLESRRAVDLAWAGQLDELIRDVDRRYGLHDLIRDSQTPFYYVTVRRQAMKRLRSALGPADYYSGRWPPHVPVAAFTRID